VAGVRYRVGRVLRAQWASVVGLTVLVALVGAVILVLVAGALRTQSSPERYADFRGGGGDLLAVNQEFGDPRVDELLSLPSVDDAWMMTFVFGGLLPLEGQEPVEGFVFAGSFDALGGQVVEGRAADPSVPGEFNADQTFADASGLHLGDHLQLVTVSEEQAAESGFEAFFSPEGPQGPTVDATLVGIIDAGPAELESSDPIAVFPSSLLDEGPVGIASSVGRISLADGSDEQAFRDDLATLPDANVFSVEPAQWVPEEVVRAVGTQATALGVVAAIAALVGLVLIGQLLTRQVRLTEEQALSLSGVGYGRRQVVVDALLRAAVPAVAGAVVAAVVAITASGLFPRGFVERVEPHPGVRFDALTHVVGPLVLVVLLVGWVAVALAVGTRVSRRRRARSAADTVASQVPFPKLALGVRFAFARPAERSRGVTTPVGGLVLAIVGLTAATIFAVSLGELIDDPERQGYAFDAGFGQGGDEVAQEVLDLFEDDPDVDAVALYGSSIAAVGDETLVMAGVEPVKGEIPVLGLDGRVPGTEEEIVLGRVAADDLDVDIGDQLEVEGDAGPATFLVTGTALIPSIEGGEGPGEDALVTGEGLARVDPGGGLGTVGIRFREGAPDDTAQRLAGAAGVPGIGRLDPPTSILNLDRVRSAPVVVGALLAGLTLLSLIVLLLVSVRARRRELAVLKAMGADRRWIGRVVHWEASIFTAVLLAVSVPVGVVLGRLLYRRLATGLGVDEDAIVPVLAITAGVLGLLVLANVVATIPRLVGRRVPWSRQLTPE
jgi:putative ABC transport system permease protein